jgi:hypothetical protein
MATLTDQDREDLWRVFMQSNTGAFGSMSKHELRAAVDATDVWIDNNAAAYNTALPQPARTALSSKQKVQLFTFIAERRWRVA